MSADLEWAVPGYTQVRELGAGAVGRVVLAVHDGARTPVAIRYLSAELLGDAEFAARFPEEARLLDGPPDPHLVRYHEYLEDPQGAAAVVMEAIDGVSLRSVLDDGPPLGPEAALVLLKGMLHALAALHAVGVVHRDVRPENLLIDGDGAAKLTDAGLAVRAAPSAYLAPERWSGGPATPAADVYAATVVFYECLTGTRPFDGMSPEARQTAPIPLDAVPEPLRLMTAHGMAKDPNARPESASALLSELHMVAMPVYGPEWERTGLRRLAELAGSLSPQFPLTGGSVPPPRKTAPTGAAAAPPPVPARSRDGLLRPRILVPAAIAVVAVLVIGIAAVVSGQNRPGPEYGPQPRAALPPAPPQSLAMAVRVMRQQMTAKRTATFTYEENACCGNEVRVTGGRLNLQGDGALAANRLVNPAKVPGGALHTPGRVVVSGDRVYVKLRSGWKRYLRANVVNGKLGSARTPQVDYGRAALDVVSEARLADLATIAPEAGKTKITHPGGLIQYAGKVHATKDVVKRTGISPDWNMPVVYAYRLRLGPDYLPRALTLRTTLMAGKSSATSTTRTFTFGSWGNVAPIRPPR